MYDPNALKIYIDGSCIKNPAGKSGLAGIIEYPDNLELENKVLFQEGYFQSTNNRMELLACIRALEFVINDMKGVTISRVIIVTDSGYVNDHKNIAAYWKKDKWRNKSGKPVENTDLWDKFLSLRSKTRVRTEIMWAEGKSFPVFKEVDKLAKQSAKSPSKYDSGYIGGMVTRAKLRSGESADLFPAKGQEAIIRIYEYKDRGSRAQKEYKIKFDLYTDNQNESSGKYMAYTLEDLGDIHRGGYYKVLFNKNTNYPIFEIIEILNKESRDVN